MAGVKGRSGGANGGPQYNPANISATGGAGQSGQPKRYIPGMPYGQGQALMQQQSGAKMQQGSKGPSFNAKPSRMTEEATMASLPQVTPLTAPTQLPEQPITYGAPVGEGPNSVPGLPMQPSTDPDIDMIRSYYPIMQFYASQPGAAQSTKDYVNYLGTII